MREKATSFKTLLAVIAINLTGISIISNAIFAFVGKELYFFKNFLNFLKKATWLLILVL